MKRKILSVLLALVLVCSFSLVTAVPAGAANLTTIASSTMVFQSDTLHPLIDNEDGTYSGTIPVVATEPAGFGDQITGFDEYARDGAMAAFSNSGWATPGETFLPIAEHDAFPGWDPDTPDWNYYALILEGNTWKLVYNETSPTRDWEVCGGVPMSGVMDWNTMYASETDFGSSFGYEDSEEPDVEAAPTDDNYGWAALHGGGPACWDIDWISEANGSEVVPLAFPGFAVVITEVDAVFTVTLTPAAGDNPPGPVVNENTGESFGTIQAAVDAAQPNDTIIVHEGTYYENVVVGEQLTLEGAKAGVDPTVEGARTDSAEESTIDAADSSLPAIKITADSVIIDGFTLTGGNPIVHISDAASVRSGITISNNVITGATDQDGIWLGGVIDAVGGFGVDNVTIVGNTITNNGRKGIFFYNGGAFAAQAISNITISGNVISDNGQSGISTYGPGPNTIINNTVGGNGDNGISIKYDTGDVVRGNTVTNNGDMGINMHAVTNCLVENNTVSGHVNDGVVTTIYGPPLTVGKGSGIYIHELSVGNTIRYNDITGNNNGVFMNSEKGDLPSGNSITYNNIAGNIHYGVLSTLPDTEPSITATNNWWGDETGPEHATLNPGAQGDAVSENVDFSPWLYKTKENFVSDAPCYAGSVVLGNEAAEVTEAEETSYEGGWNSFSTPVTLDGSADYISEILALTAESDLSIVRAQRFDLDSQEWVALVMGGVLTGDDYQIKPGEGFFIQVESKGSLPILCSTDPTSPPRTDLVAGWNLVGLSNFTKMDVESALYNVNYSVVLSASPPNAASWSVPPDTVSTNMKLGGAYWLGMGQPEILFGHTTTPVADAMTWKLNQN